MLPLSRSREAIRGRAFLFFFRLELYPCPEWRLWCERGYYHRLIDCLKRLIGRWMYARTTPSEDSFFLEDLNTKLRNCSRISKCHFTASKIQGLALVLFRGSPKYRGPLCIHVMRLPELTLFSQEYAWVVEYKHGLLSWRWVQVFGILLFSIDLLRFG